MSSAGLKPPTGPSGLKALARELLEGAWPRQRSGGLQDPVEAVSAKMMRRRALPKEELALIDALSLLVGPAFAAAMERSDLAEKVRRASR